MNLIAFRTDKMMQKIQYVQRLCRRHPEAERLQIVHQYIVEHVHYEAKESLPVHEAAGFFEYGIAVCDGISKAAKILLQAVGIRSEIIYGKAAQTPGKAFQPHAWNLVWTNGRAYHVDFTFDATLAEDDGLIHYDYYNLTDRQIGTDHMFPEQKTGLAATLPADWFRQNGTYFTEKKKLRQYIRSEIGKKSKSIVIRLPQTSDPETVLEDTKAVIREELGRVTLCPRTWQYTVNEAQMIVCIWL